MKIDILEIKQNENGTCDIVFDYDDEYLQFVKESLKKEDPTEEEIAEFLSEAIQREVERVTALEREKTQSE